MSLDRPSDEAEQILGGWTALFHPALVAKYRRLPTWERASYPLSENEQELIVIPACCGERPPERWLEKQQAAGAVVLDEATDREAIAAWALETAGVADHAFDDDFVQDFYAVGYGYFMVELLTRQLRYMSNLDTVQLESEMCRAIEQYEKGDREAADHRLRAAMDALTEAREYFYPIDTYLVDLTLAAPSVFNDDFARELRESRPLNLVLTGETLRTLVDTRPDLVALLREAIADERAVLIGGEEEELPLPLLPMEPLLAHLRRGVDFYARHTGVRPAVFARQKRGLTACLPGLLAGLGYSGALHYTFDGDLFQKGNQSKIRWKGDDGAAIDALIRFPIEPREANTFLQLPETVGQTMDLDHVSTLLFAHWPGHVSRWFDAIRRMARCSPAFGSITDIKQYFSATQYAGQAKTFDADTYRSGYLREAVGRGLTDPVSCWRRYYRAHALARHLQGLLAMEQFITGRAQDQSPAGRLIGEAERLESPFAEVARETEPPEADSSDDIATRLQRAIRQISMRIAEQLPRDTSHVAEGVLVLNPSSHPRRETVDCSSLAALPEKGGPVVCVQQSGGEKWVIGDVPPLGYAWFGEPTEELPEEQPSRRPLAALFSWTRRGDEEKPMAEETTLRNDYFEATLDPATGALQSLFSFATRGNRLAQQVALRFPEAVRRRDPRSEEDPNYGYSIMAVDSIEVESPGPIAGRIRTGGRLVGPDGATIARYRQWHTVRRASRVLELDIEIDPVEPPGENPWDSYYALRLAWSDATADCTRSVNSTRRTTEAELLEAPQMLDFRAGKAAVTLLCGGLPFHRRQGLRQLDTLLIVAGETSRRFRLGIGIDLPNPMQSALAFMTPDLPTMGGVPAPQTPTAWLEHVDARNVVVSAREVKTAGAKVTGYRLRLLEVDGAACEVGLRLCRSARAAQRVDFRGEVKQSLEVGGDRIVVPMAAHELVEIDIDF